MKTVRNESGPKIELVQHVLHVACGQTVYACGKVCEESYVSLSNPSLSIKLYFTNIVSLSTHSKVYI
jgi:hypothetical protein